jgi:predicted phosphodiesterase
MTDRQRIVRDACEKFPDKASRSLARALFKKYPRDFPNLEATLTSVRKERGATGKHNLKHSSNGTVMRLPALPKSMATPWLPFDLPSKMLGSLSDLHIPYHSKEAIQVAVKDLKKYKCDTILINGDGLDFYQISRFTKGPGRPSVKEELMMTNQFLKYLRAHFPKARSVWKMGPHEERWDAFMMQRAPEVFDLTEDTWQKCAGFEKHGVELVKDGRIIMVGKLPVLHGHELPKGITNPVNPARGAFLRTLDCVLIGHHHRTSEHTERTMLGRTISTKSQGCLCDLSPEYARINRWDHGYAIVEVSKSGDYHCMLRKIINGKPY